MNFTMGTGIGALGNPGNTGDGLRLAQSMGAKLWHMNAYSAGLDVRYPGYATNVAASLKGAGYIWVDQDGRRFANELTDGHCQIYVASQIDAVNPRRGRRIRGPRKRELPPRARRGRRPPSGRHPRVRGRFDGKTCPCFSPCEV